MLPSTWVITLFDKLLMTGSYPTDWITAKLFTIYKRKSKAIPSNFRAISVINIEVKLYNVMSSNGS